MRQAKLFEKQKALDDIDVVMSQLDDELESIKKPKPKKDTEIAPMKQVKSDSK